MGFNRLESALIFLTLLTLLIFSGTISRTFRILEVMPGITISNMTYEQKINQSFEGNQTYTWMLSEDCTGIDCSL